MWPPLGIANLLLAKGGLTDDSRTPVSSQADIFWQQRTDLRGRRPSILSSLSKRDWGNSQQHDEVSGLRGVWPGHPGVLL